MHRNTSNYISVLLPKLERVIYHHPLELELNFFDVVKFKPQKSSYYVIGTLKILRG